MEGKMVWPAKVTICEVGLRDGIQNETKILSVEEKLALLDAVVASGIRVVEIGSFVHPKAVPQMANTGELAKAMKRAEGVEYRVLVPNLKGLERAHDAGITKAKLTVSVSETHCMANFNQTPLQMMEGFKPCVEFAAKNGIAISGALSSAWGCAWEGKIPAAQIEKITRAFLDLGITELSLSDATGMANPRHIYELGGYMRKTFPQVTWVLHLHNTRGMALACATAALQAGITVFDGAFAGFGGCNFIPDASGNVATEDLIHMLHEMNVDTGVDLVRAMETGRLAESLLGHRGDSYVLRAGRCVDLTTKQAAKQNNT
ncbi:Pyruvate carboxyltransferase [uncultured delta proteobacterium]|uniref:Pyruvate carboxyltransferase n=1 Tax=uncultured delta proteobacterium TaxID=34034 RepID=A0A212KEK0_9DELT|nr:Pyruvate carboxyltransferase [uncultured delta proteobacterium]